MYFCDKCGTRVNTEPAPIPQNQPIPPQYHELTAKEKSAQNTVKVMLALAVFFMICGFVILMFVFREVDCTSCDGKGSTICSSCNGTLEIDHKNNCTGDGCGGTHWGNRCVNGKFPCPYLDSEYSNCVTPRICGVCNGSGKK
jgi:hypothetical protein